MAERNVLPIPQVAQPTGHATSSRPRLYILDYGAGNVRRSARTALAIIILTRVVLPTRSTGSATSLSGSSLPMILTRPRYAGCCTPSAVLTSAEAHLPRRWRLRTSLCFPHQLLSPSASARLHRIRPPLLRYLHRYANALLIFCRIFRVHRPRHYPLPHQQIPHG